MEDPPALDEVGACVSYGVLWIVLLVQRRSQKSVTLARCQVSWEPINPWADLQLGNNVSYLLKMVEGAALFTHPRDIVRLGNAQKQLTPWYHANIEIIIMRIESGASCNINRYLSEVGIEAQTVELGARAERSPSAKRSAHI